MTTATLPAEIAAIEWPDPASVTVVTRKRRQVYQTPCGDMPRVTSTLKVLGLGTEALVGWAGQNERRALLEAVETVIQGGLLDRLPYPTIAEDWGPAAMEFVHQVEDHIGPAREHQKLIAKAAEIGSSVHERIHWHLRGELGMPRGPEPPLVEQGLWAYMAWEDWWKASGYLPVRSEQPVYSAQRRYAGQIDLIAWHPDKGLGIEDFKTGKYIYDEAHLQVRAYVEAACQWAPIEWAEILRLPKVTDDPAFEVRPLGRMYNRTLTWDQLLQAFDHALRAWELLVAPVTS